MNILVFAEKAGDWKEIARSLTDWEVRKKWINSVEVDWFDWNNITVFWWAGHFLNLKNPKDLGYERHYKNLPYEIEIDDFKADLSFEGKNELLKSSIELLKSEKYELLVFAWDAWREWLVIMDRIYKESWSTLPIEYIWKNDSSKDEVRKLWKKRLKWEDELNWWEKINGLKKAWNLRALADWKLGMNLSTIDSIYYKALNSDYLKFRIWRVITPTLNMILHRENQILEFKKERLYYLEWEVQNIWSFKYVQRKDENKSYTSKTKEKLEEVYLDIINEKKIEITGVENKKTKIKPSYWLNWANIKMAKKLWISPKKVLCLIDEMYNIDWILSYPRVESRYITQDELTKIIDIIKFLEKNLSKIEPQYGRVIKYIVWNDFKTTIPIVNEKKVIEWHGAFHIKQSKWEVSRNKILEVLNSDGNKWRIYRKVLENNLWFFLPECENVQTKFTGKCKNHEFENVVNYTEKLGYRILDLEWIEYKPEHIDKLTEWTEVKLNNLEIKHTFTKAPDRVSVDSILLYMCHPEKLFKDINEKEVYKILDRSEWIWQPATRENIIENIITEKYVEVKKWLFYVTDSGRKVLEYADNNIKSITITAKMESLLRKVSETNSDQCQQELLSIIDEIIEKNINWKLNNEVRKRIDESLICEELIEKSPEGFKLFVKKSSKWFYYAYSKDDIWKNGKPKFYSKYDYMNKKIISEDICDTKIKCKICWNWCVVRRNNKNDSLYVQCRKRLYWECDFISSYSLDKDEAIENWIIDWISCKKCWGEVRSIVSKKDWTKYAVCKKWKDICNYIEPYNSEKWEIETDFMPKNMELWELKYNWEETYENSRLLKTRDWWLIIWKEMCWLKLSRNQIKELLENWISKKEIEWFTSKRWTKFNAKLKINQWKVEFIFS